MGAPLLLYFSRDPDHAGERAAALGDDGFDVVVAPPSEGRELVEEHQPDATIVDAASSEDAADLIKWLRETSPWRDKPCFVLRAETATAKALKAEVRGIRWVRDDVVAQVREAFRGRMGFMVNETGRGMIVDEDNDVMIV